MIGLWCSPARREGYTSDKGLHLTSGLIAHRRPRAEHEDMGRTFRVALFWQCVRTSRLPNTRFFYSFLSFSRSFSGHGFPPFYEGEPTMDDVSVTCSPLEFRYQPEGFLPHSTPTRIMRSRACRGDRYGKRHVLFNPAYSGMLVH